jgi:hypothetical protein
LAELYGANIGSTIIQNAKTLAGVGIPQATNATIESARCDQPLIRSPGESGDRPLVPAEGVQAVPCLNVPDLNLGYSSIASRHQAQAIRAESSVHLLRLNWKLVNANWFEVHILEIPLRLPDDHEPVLRDQPPSPIDCPVFAEQPVQQRRPEETSMPGAAYEAAVCCNAGLGENAHLPRDD